jgi:predicted PurR-regulated permease PerM
MVHGTWPEAPAAPAEDGVIEVKVEVERPEPPPLPSDSRVVLLTGIFTLILFYTLYFVAEIAIPLIFALLLKLLLQPGVRTLGRFRVPQPVAALIMIAALFGGLGVPAYVVMAPGAAWLEKAPQSLPRLEQHLRIFRLPIARVQQATQQLEKIAEPGGDGAAAVTLKGPGLVDYILASTRHLLAGLGITVLLLFFLLSAGDLFMRRLVEILPTFRDKKQAVEMSHEIEYNISAYLLTISAMNALVGAATAAAMYVIGLSDPILWGALAFLLNYVLILGPLTMLVLLFVVGLLSFDPLWLALLPPAVYIVIHIIEGELVTPMLVARRFTLNPVLVIGSLIFWNWMWGIPGALLAVPMLAVFKIVCDRVRPLAAVGHFMGGQGG